jgi:hypothetical protein
LEFCLKHTHKNCMNGLKKPIPRDPRCMNYPSNQGFTLPTSIGGFQGPGTHLLAESSWWAGYTPAPRELSVGRVHTCLPRALGGQAQHAC